MILAAINSTMYEILLLLHILSVMVAVAPGFVLPLLGARMQSQTGQPMSPLVAKVTRMNTMTVHIPALALGGILGFGMIAMSDEVWEFSQAWVGIAILAWIAMFGVLLGVMVPAEKKVEAGDASGEKGISMAGGILHLLLLVILIMMVFKPGA